QEGGAVSPVPCGAEGAGNGGAGDGGGGRREGRGAVGHARGRGVADDAVFRREADFSAGDGESDDRDADGPERSGRPTVRDVREGEASAAARPGAGGVAAGPAGG